MWPSNVKKHTTTTTTTLIYLIHTHTHTRTHHHSHAHLKNILKNLDSDRHSFIYIHISLTSLFVSKDLYNIVYRHIQHLRFTRYL